MAKEEVPEEPAVESEESPKASGFKAMLNTRNLIILGSALIIIPVVAFFLVTKVFHPMADGQLEEQKMQKEEGIKTVYMLEPIIVNVAGTKGMRYLKVTVGLELNEATLQAEVEKRNPQLVDILIRVFSSRSLKDISEPRGRDGIRREILTRLNDILTTGRLINVYFTEFVIQ